MRKFKWISLLIKVLGIIIALGLGIWYLSSSIGGAALTYTSVDAFMHAIGADNGIENIGTMFLGTYVIELLDMLGVASEMFWAGIVKPVDFDGGRIGDFYVYIGHKIYLGKIQEKC